jgi:enoyl-CoA hydratase/carnithine racemase
MTGQVLCEKADGVGWVTFSNPSKRNAMTLEMWQDMARILQALQQDAAIRVVVMRGAGDKAFMSGADISQFEANRDSAAAAAAYDAISEESRQWLVRLDKPLIAMIRGFCLGGGLGVALTADLRFAADDARFGIPAANLGTAYSVGSVRRLVHVVGPSAAKDILFSTRRVDATEALRLGLVSRVTAPETLEETVRDYAALLATKAPLSLRASKAAVDEVTKPEGERDAERIRALVAACFDSADYAEGRRAFMEKRAPVFRGA